MKMKAYLAHMILFVLMSNQAFSETITITPTGGDDTTLIQKTLDGLSSGDTLQLNGDFIFGRTLYLPSDFIWILNGTLTLAGNADLNEAGWIAPGIDATRRTGITEKSGGATNIDMSGGTYYGNSANYSKSMRFINFVSVTNSNFHDMHITQVTDDNFTLGPGSNTNECRNLIGSFAGGNALTDKGDHNKWYDCIAEDCDSDGWTPKCRYSEFYRCIARRNDGPGFGMYCRIDGSGNPVDLGESIDNNKFFDCESYENNASGFSFNISSTSGEGGTIRNNFIQARCYNNDESGVRFRNKMPNSIVDNNEIDILTYGNRGNKKSGGPSSTAGGLGTDASYPVTRITGSVVSYDNGQYDVNIGQATNSDITVYRPLAENETVLKSGANTNNITIVDFICSDELIDWCQEEYCDQTLGLYNLEGGSIPLFELYQNYPNPMNLYSKIEYAIAVESIVTIKVYDLLGKELDTIVNENQMAGQYEMDFNRGNLPNGTYFYKISANDFIKTKKFI